MDHDPAGLKYKNFMANNDSVLRIKRNEEGKVQWKNGENLPQMKNRERVKFNGAGEPRPN